MTIIRRLSGRSSVRGDSGYMLLVLMIAVAVLMITMLSVVHDYKKGIQRDREVEMIHRGEQYERAIKRFYKKNSRYPVSLEQLEDMNKVRYLRKRYKDPMSSDGEWKVVHPTDFKMTGSVTPAATGAATTDPNAKVDPSQTAPDAGSNTTGVNQGGGTGSASGTSTGTSGGSDSGNGVGTSAFGNNSGSTATGTSATQSAFGTPSGANNAANGQVLGGGDIYGVVSKSKNKGFHIYGEKEKYNEWFFIYDPNQDLTSAGAIGRLLVGPYNPKMFVGSANSGLNSNKGTSGSSGTGGSPGTINTPSGSTSGTATPTQPAQ